MGLLDPLAPPYDPLDWSKRPFSERARMVCQAWALQGYGTPIAAFGFYALKIALYIGGFFLWCRSGGLTSTPTWWLRPLAFEKAIIWSLLYEVLGLGCGSGPLTGRYFPPLGGALYFLRPGTTKLPLFANTPLVGGKTRGAVDVLLYLALLVSCVRALLSPSAALLLPREVIVPIVVLVPLLGVLDKTIFLAARGEHYWTTLVCFAVGGSFGGVVAGAKSVQIALWFWAGFSKLNQHFPTVVCVMTSNGPLTRWPSLRRRMYRSYPDDLRPSALARGVAHLGTALEIGVPLAFLLTPIGSPPFVAIVLMLMLHGYITSNVPMGVPLEWNIMVAYGGFALFWAHPEISLAALTPWWLIAFLAVMLVAVPLAGNLWPSRVSFLMAMRYYAGNWPYSIWLFRGESYRKLARMKMTSPWVYDQLDRFYDKPTAVGLVGKVMGFRLMHLHGRALPVLLPRAVDHFEDYEWLDGEIVAGLVLGWNFGDGHLHHEQLLDSVQSQCTFDSGELRCIFVEPQPLGRGTLDYRICDAHDGKIDHGTLRLADLPEQPW